MNNFINNFRSIIIGLIIGIVFFIILNFINTVYCVSEIEKLKKYHSNVCPECGQVLNNK